MSRWAIVDDADPSVSYTGIWSAVKFNESTGVTNSGFSLRNAMMRTGHSLSSIGHLSYAFNGSQIALYGVSSALTISEPDLPVWECFIDGQSIGSNQAYGSLPWTNYCNKEDLPESPHFITVYITATVSKPFWLDFIRYAPFANTSFDNKNSTLPAVHAANQVPLIRKRTSDDSDEDHRMIARIIGISMIFGSLFVLALAGLLDRYIKRRRRRRRATTPFVNPQVPDRDNGLVDHHTPSIMSVQPNGLSHLDLEGTPDEAAENGAEIPIIQEEARSFSEGEFTDVGESNDEPSGRRQEPQDEQGTQVTEVIELPPMYTLE